MGLTRNPPRCRTMSHILQYGISSLFGWRRNRVVTFLLISWWVGCIGWARESMKTLANLDDKLELLRRLGGIGPASQRRWGKMTAPEMICHLSDALRVGLGERQAKPVWNWF